MKNFDIAAREQRDEEKVFIDVRVFFSHSKLNYEQRDEEKNSLFGRGVKKEKSFPLILPLPHPSRASFSDIVMYQIQHHSARCLSPSVQLVGSELEQSCDTNNELLTSARDEELAAILSRLAHSIRLRIPLMLSRATVGELGEFPQRKGMEKIRFHTFLQSITFIKSP